MDHTITTDTLSEEGRRALETVSGLALVSQEQQDHAWRILLAELDLRDQPQAAADDLCDLFVSGTELAALRVLIAWLRGSERAGLVAHLSAHLAVAEGIVGQLGEMPWPDVWQPSYLQECEGGTLWLDPHVEAPALLYLLQATLTQSQRICPGWPAAERAQVIGLLCDVWYWLHTMSIAIND
jgi:hypothetical protein